MFSIACKGLHCAGCGKGIPASLIVIIAAIVAFNSRAFDNALGRTLVEIAALVALAWVVTMVLYVVFMRKGPRIVNTKTDGIWYSEIKYMETGDREWLAFSERREIAPKMAAPVIIGSEVEHVERNTRLRVALLHGRASKRQDV
jgi:hypothetical protein